MGMTTRRELIAGLAAAGVLAACRPAITSTQEPTDRLLVRHPDGLGLFDVGTRQWLAAPASATASGLALASLDNGTLSIRDTQTGRISSQTELAGTWSPLATHGTQVALVEGKLEPRNTTKLLIMRGGQEWQRFELPGNVVPEAFSPNGYALYVLDYVPPKTPDGYRVRAVDLSTGRVLPLSLATQFKQLPTEPDEVMRGQGRRAVYDATRDILFTLYIRAGSDPDMRAFIHCLNLAQGWAYCVDLPEPFGLTDATGHTIAMATDNGMVFAVNAEAGVVASVNPDQLYVTDTWAIAPVRGEAAAIGLPGRQVLVGAGQQLSLVDYQGHREFSLDFPVRGLGVGSRIWVGRDDGVSTVDIATGAVGSRVDIPGLVEVSQAFARR